MKAQMQGGVAKETGGLEAAGSKKNGKRKKKDDEKKRKKDRKGGKKKPRGPSLAELADRHDLYQRAVQDVESDVDFLVSAWHEVYGDLVHPRHFREDFCGTAAMCAEWVGRGDDRTAEGIDIDPECLEWGRVHNLEPLGEAAGRIELHQIDVRASTGRRADVRCAHNFSYQIFERRADLAEYFRAVRDGLSDQGLFVMDLYGGSEAVEEILEEREIEDGDFTYVWEQRSFHPATGHTDCYIHFRFRDGSELPEAFTYTWRLYSPPELRDLLLECGFREVRTYFEEFDEDGDGTGHFARDEEGPACEGWLGYMVAIP